jgi:hypothetical protein
VKSLALVALPDRLAVARLPAGLPPPGWALAGDGFLALTRTEDEVSIIAPEDAIPPRVEREDGWRALRVDGTLDFALTGVLASLAGPLAEADVPIFAISTYDTDYILVREDDLERAVEALAAAGHRVSPPPG